jgi:hypothetical protein
MRLVMSTFLLRCFRRHRFCVYFLNQAELHSRGAPPQR